MSTKPADARIVKKGKKSESSEFDSDAERQSKLEKKRAEREAAEIEHKKEMKKFIEERKAADTSNVGIMQFEDLLQVPASSSNILVKIKECERRGFEFVTSIFYVTQIFLIFRKKSTK